MAKTYQPTEAMQVNSSRGKALKKKKKTERSYEAPYEMTAKSFNQELSLDDVKATYRFLVKQKEKINKYNVDIDGEATEEYLDWLDAGATAGLAWSTSILQEEGILKSVTQQIEKSATEVVEKDKWDSISVTKAVDEELMQATFLVLAPDEVDLHGDTYSADEIRKACHNFNLHCGVANLLHLMETTSFSFVESYITKSDEILGETFIKKGSWCVVAQFWVPEIWEEVKKGNYTGVSVGCVAKVEYLEDKE